ncbi:hypothetical protein IAT38_002743 [Cryptococcus sp. DSM 104549]
MAYYPGHDEDDWMDEPPRYWDMTGETRFPQAGEVWIRIVWNSLLEGWHQKFYILGARRPLRTVFQWWVDDHYGGGYGVHEWDWDWRPKRDYLTGNETPNSLGLPGYATIEARPGQSFVDAGY